MQTLNALYLAAATSPSAPISDEDRYRSIGPGWAGFVATAALAVVVIFLIWDMMRRIRRIRYTSAQQERSAQLVELGEQEAAETQARREAAARSEAQAAAADDLPAQPKPASAGEESAR